MGLNSQIATATETTLPALTQEEFRDAMGRFATGIAVMTTLDVDGKPYGVTVTSFTSLSLEPQLVQWSLRSAAWSLPIFTVAGRFVVNILSADQETVSRRFATPDIDRFSSLAVEAGLGGVPLVNGALAWVECVLETTWPVGDHTIIVGRALRAHTFDGTPLVRWRGGYQRIANETLNDRN